MSEAQPFYLAQHLGDRVELRPSPRLIRSKQGLAGCFLLLPVPALALSWFFGEQWLTAALIGFGICIPLWLLSLNANRRIRAQSEIPLVIGPAQRVMHGEKLLHDGSPLSAVQLQEIKFADDPDGFDVLLIPETRATVELPGPYFGYLDFDEAVLLANEVASYLQVPFVRKIVPAISKSS